VASATAALDAAKRKVTRRTATIVYSVTAYHKLDHLQWLLEQIYEPQHFYVLNVDRKSSDEFYEQVCELARSLGPNVVMSERRYDIIYYGWSAMYVELQAWFQAIRMGQARDYFINMSGQEYPIKTRCELTSFLTEHMGLNFISTIPTELQPWLRVPVRCRGAMLPLYRALLTNKGRPIVSGFVV